MQEISLMKTSNGSSQWRGTEEDLLADEGFKNLQSIHKYLLEKGYCHVKVLEGDYKGSVAKFTLGENEDLSKESAYKKVGGFNKGWYNIKYYFNGRLSWKGKRNNPQFTIIHGKCEVLLDYYGEEVLERLNLKTGGKTLLENTTLYDVQGKPLSKGDIVWYINLRYGNGARLSHGKVKEFKPHVREKYVSVIIEEDDTGQQSECKYPRDQLLLCEK